MTEKSIIVIGAGIAGLSAGCYARMNGYRTQIFEMHSLPGGLCTAWTRKGYTIDGCISWLVGSDPGDSFHQLWREVGLVQGREMIHLGELSRFVSREGREFTFYTDLDRLEQHMLEVAPEDRVTIEDFVGATRQLLKFDMQADLPPQELMSPADLARVGATLGPYMPFLQKWGPVTLGEFATRFKSALLRETFATFMSPKFGVLFLMMTLAWLHRRVAGYPIGGSLPMARAVETRFLGLGGQIHYDSRVTQILVENDRAVGVRLADGREERADVVISAADGHATIFGMLGGAYVDDTIRRMYSEWTPFPGLVFVGLGVNRTFEAEPQSISGYSLPLDPPLTIAGETKDRIGVRICNYDPTLAPAGKTVITAMLTGRYDDWKRLYADRQQYEAEKSRIAEAVIRLLDGRYPGLAEQVEMVDVASPITFERYTGNWQGSFEGWIPTPENFAGNVSKTLPGLDGFYMVGQWVSPGGGLPSGVKTGRDVVRMICVRDGQPFQTRIAPSRSVEPG